MYSKWQHGALKQPPPPVCILPSLHIVPVILALPSSWLIHVCVAYAVYLEQHRSTLKTTIEETMYYSSFCCFIYCVINMHRIWGQILTCSETVPRDNVRNSFLAWCSVWGLVSAHWVTNTAYGVWWICVRVTSVSFKKSCWGFIAFFCQEAWLYKLSNLRVSLDRGELELEG